MSIGGGREQETFFVNLKIDDPTVKGIALLLIKDLLIMVRMLLTKQSPEISQSKEDNYLF